MNVKFALLGLCGSLALIGLSGCAANIADEQQLMTGKRIAFERSKGNCLACHVIANGEEPGNIGQPLVAIAAHYHSKTQLRAHIWDQTQFNPETSMPPFGRNKILTETEIDQVVDYLWSL
ncbi:MAG: sulfur oxidation c-type cytochrome SoxX [Methylococcales bacterium]